ncbi:hypothetical protein MD588_24795 [Photobacterium sp. SDRW27]|uniref:hypothetical protein n=1 Tax=Photobacterium obscurum TaxID=2829490 RepID=UPI002242E423|nr:hypothetical protein [Photobacterium obscurum]MCW8332015.1 hypothetical protein [Photobacterium obscurum]
MDKTTILEKYKSALLHENKRVPFSSRLEHAPNAAGIYGVFLGHELIYVGESGCVKKRMRDVGSTYNHTLRRSIGAENFHGLPDYVPATSKRKFPDHIEALLDEYFSGLMVSFVEIDFGRTETEEYLVELLSPKYNKKKKRKFA